MFSNVSLSFTQIHEPLISKISALSYVSLTNSLCHNTHLHRNSHTMYYFFPVIWGSVSQTLLCPGPVIMFRHGDPPQVFLTLLVNSGRINTFQCPHNMGDVTTATERGCVPVFYFRGPVPGRDPLSGKRWSEVISYISKVFQSMSNPDHEVMMKEVTRVALTCVGIGLIIGFTSFVEVSIKQLKSILISNILKVDKYQNRYTWTDRFLGRVCRENRSNTLLVLSIFYLFEIFSNRPLFHLGWRYSQGIHPEITSTVIPGSRDFQYKPIWNL